MSKLLIILFALTLAGCRPICSEVEPTVAGQEAYVVGGELSQDRRATVMVLGTRWCTGTVVGPRTVLTAAHCVAGAESVTIEWHEEYRLGKWRIGQRIADDWEVHPTFNERHARDWLGDIAVVYTIDELPGPFAEVAQGSQQCYPGATAQGYGITEKGNDYGTLRERIVYLVGMTNQVLKYTAGMCAGDSGGPIYLNTVDGSLVVVGVQSQVKNTDCSPGFRDIAAKAINLLHYGGWVIERIW